jgi:hypothetical protein
LVTPSEHHRERQAVSEQAKWLGQPIKNGLRVGPLQLEWATGGQACVWLTGGGAWACVIDWCPLSEVNARTIAWIREIAALDPRAKADADLLAAGERLRDEAAAYCGQDIIRLVAAYDTAKSKRSAIE